MGTREDYKKSLEQLNIAQRYDSTERINGYVYAMVVSAASAYIRELESTIEKLTTPQPKHRADDYANGHTYDRT